MVPDKFRTTICTATILISFIVYNVSMVGGIFMIIWYAESGFNTVFICTMLLLVCLMPLIALMSKQAKGRYLELGLVGGYILFLCWSAIRSEPETSGCQNEKTNSDEKWKTMISFAFGPISIIVLTFSTGSDYKSMQFRNAVESEHDTPPYGYGFFHLIFVMGSMYFGMLFADWGTHHIIGKWNMDVGCMCTWVQIVKVASKKAVINF